VRWRFVMDSSLDFGSHLLKPLFFTCGAGTVFRSATPACSVYVLWLWPACTRLENAAICHQHLRLQHWSSSLMRLRGNI
jgi:hypothetical protein